MLLLNFTHFTKTEVDTIYVLYMIDHKSIESYNGKVKDSCFTLGFSSTDMAPF
jgi:hypothetical protein